MESLLSELCSVFSAKLPRITNEASFYFRPEQAQKVLTSGNITNDRTKKSYSLLCPLSLKLQEIPVRTNCCQHVDTVDLLGLLRSWPKSDLISSYAKFKLSSKIDTLQNCPICKVRGSLYVDGNVENFINSNLTVEKNSFAETGKAVAIASSKRNLDHDGQDEVNFHWQHFANSPNVWSMGETAGQTSVADKMEKAMLNVRPRCVETMTSPRSPCLWWESHPVKSPSLWWECQAPSPQCRSPIYSQASTFSFNVSSDGAFTSTLTSRGNSTLQRRRLSTVDLISPKF